MADFVYNTGANDIGMDQIIDVITDALLKAMLVTSSYVADRDDDVVDAAGANDAIDHELSGTGYTGGFGGSGRKVLASKSLTVDKANNRVEFDCADIVWTAINAGTPSQMLIIRELTDDTATRLVSHHDSGFPVTTNGGDLTVTIDAEGLIQERTT